MTLMNRQQTIFAKLSFGDEFAFSQGIPYQLFDSLGKPLPGMKFLHLSKGSIGISQQLMHEGTLTDVKQIYADIEAEKKYYLVLASAPALMLKKEPT